MAIDDLDAVDKLIDTEEAAEVEKKINPFSEGPPETPAQAAATTEAKSRRQKAQEARDAEKKALDDRFAQYDSQIGATSAQIAAQREEIARLQGALSQRQAPVVQAPAGPSADELLRQATKALDDKDTTEYHRLLREAHRADVAEQIAAVQRQIPDPRQYQQPPQNDFSDVRRALDRNLARAPKLAELPEDQVLNRVSAECGVLISEGGRPGPALFAKAVDNCEARISGRATRATFARGNGIPMDRHVSAGGAGGGDDEDVGTPEQREVWRRSGLPMSEFKKYAQG